MRRSALLLSVGCAIVATQALAQPQQLAHFEDLLQWHVTPPPGNSGAGFTAGFVAFGRRFDLALEANHRVDPAPAAQARALRGTLRGSPQSWARLVITADGPAGMIWDGATLFGVEPQTGGRARIFRADDVVVPAGAMSCGVHAPASDAATMFAELTQSSPAIAAALGATLNMNLGVVADTGFAAQYADAATAMLVRANNIDGIYSEQIGVQVSVEQIDVFTDAQIDPFTDTTDAETLLDELAVYRGDTPAQDAQGLTHLFTGRNLDGTTVGLAFLGTVCARRSQFDPQRRSFAVGLTQANRGVAGTFLESLIAAHEIGHNFGAPHDGEQGQCVDAPPGYLMAPSVSPTAQQFSQCSVEVITGNLPSFGCLTPIPVVDLAIEGRGQTETRFADIEFDYLVDVTNLGQESSTITTVQLAFDAGVEVLAAAPQSGNCTPASQNLTCNLGEIPGADTRTVRVTVRSDEPGERIVSGSVTAPEDANSANDAFTASVSVVAGSDLALVTAPQMLRLGEPVTVSASLENRSDTATGEITLSGTYTAGLQIDAAALSGSACTIAAEARTLTCGIPSLDEFSSAAIEVTLTGTHAGSQMLTLSASATQADPVPADNHAGIALEVTDSSGQTGATDSDDGGGGSLGPTALFALLGAWAGRRRSARRRKANFS